MSFVFLPPTITSSEYILGPTFFRMVFFLKDQIISKQSTVCRVNLSESQPPHLKIRSAGLVLHNFISSLGGNLEGGRLSGYNLLESRELHGYEPEISERKLAPKLIFFEVQGNFITRGLPQGPI